MSFGQWLALLALFVAYLVFGGAVFMVVESPHEETHLEELDGIRQLVYGTVRPPRKRIRTDGDGSITM